MKRPFLIIIFLSISTFYASADTATVSWQPNNEKDLAGYRVYHGTASRSYGAPEAVAKTTTCCSFDGLAKGTTYYFAVTAVDTSGNESGYSAEVSKFIAEAQPGAPPTSVNLVASLPSPQTAGKKVTFTANASGKGDYEYKFYCNNRPAQGYSPSNTFVWDTAGLRGTKRIVVHVRSKGANVRYQKYAYIRYRVTADSAIAASRASSPISTVEKRNRLIMLYQKYFKHFSWNVTPKS